MSFPGETHTYYWYVTKNTGPTTEQEECSVSAYYSTVGVIKVYTHTHTNTHVHALIFSPCWLGSIQWSDWPLNNLSPELGQVSVSAPGGRLSKS